MAAKTPSQDVTRSPGYGRYYLFFVSYAVLTAVLYRARFTHDLAQWCFWLTNTGKPYVIHQRWASQAPFQLLPLLLLKAGASLKTIMFAWSLMYAVLHALVAGLLVSVFHRRDLLKAYCFYLAVYLTHTFFYPQTELGNLILLYAFPLIAVLEWTPETRTGRLVQGPVCALLTLGVVTGHTLGMPVALFVIAFVAVRTKTLRDAPWRLLTLTLAMMALWVIAKFTLLRFNTYEAPRLEQFSPIWLYKNFGPNLRFMVWHHFLLFGALAWYVAALVRSRGRALALWVGLAFTTGYLALCFSEYSYRTAGANGGMYLWHVLQPAYYFAFVPMLTHSENKTDRLLRRGCIALCVIQALYAAWGLLHDAVYEGHRIQIATNMLNQGRTVESPILLVDNPALEGYSVWALGYETALRTALTSAEDTKVLVSPDWYDFDKAPINDRYFNPAIGQIGKAHSLVSLGSSKQIKHTLQQCQVTYANILNINHFGKSRVRVYLENGTQHVLPSRLPSDKPVRWIYRWHKMGPEGETWSSPAFTSEPLRTDVLAGQLFSEWLTIRFDKPPEGTTLVVGLRAGQEEVWF